MCIRDRLRDHHGGMGVVDLDDRLVGQVVVVAALGSRFLQDQAGCVGHHEILLIDAQHPSGAVAVVRIEEEGQILLDVRFVKGNAVLHHGFVHRFHVKQVELVGAVVVAGHRNVVPVSYTHLPAADHRQRSGGKPLLKGGDGEQLQRDAGGKADPGMRHF